MSGTTWVYIMLGIYIIYCFYWGLKGYFSEKTSAGYAIAGRSIPFIAFLMAATAASFSGWTFIGHPGLIWRDGLAYAFASFYVLTIPITGAFFAKRNWLLGKRYGFITPGDMFAYYFNSEAARWLTVFTAFLYSMFYSAVQLMASAALFHWVAGVPVTFGAIFMAFIVWFYVCSGGLKASTWVGVLQFILLVGGIILLGYYVITSDAIGGWTAFTKNLMEMPPDVKHRLLEVPAVIYPTMDTVAYAKANNETIWTAVMILSYMFALMGIQSSPAFTLWNFGIKNPKPLAWQQTFMSTFVVGFALFYFTAFQGMGSKILQLQGVLEFTKDSDVVPILMKTYLPPFVLGIVFLGAIAAIHSTAAPYIGTGGTILLRDVYWRYIRKQQAGHCGADLGQPHSGDLRNHRRFVGRADLQSRPGYFRGPGHCLRVRDVRLSLGGPLGLPFPECRRFPGGSRRHGRCFSDLLCLEVPALLPLRGLGDRYRSAGGLSLPRPRHQGQRGDDQAPERGAHLP